MGNLWWQLPGPRHFIDGIVQGVRVGKSVILCLPRFMPDGLKIALKAEICQTNEWEWCDLPLNSDNRAPIDILYSHFVSESPTHALRSAFTLSQEETFEGKVIWVENVDKQTWRSWQDFLLEYEQACRSMPALARSTFCVALIGETALQPPPENVCLSNFYWKGVVTPFDMLFFVTSLMQTRSTRDMQKRLMIAMVADLALWDPCVAEIFSGSRIEDILNPVPLLQEIAEEREWAKHVQMDSERLEVNPRLWSDGLADIFEGKPRLHSSILTLNDPRKEIDRRIWNAQIRTLLPMVEEKRRELLEKLDGILMVPYETRSGAAITDIYDLEIGHIYHQLATSDLNTDPKLRDLAWQLKEIRNRLSHLEALSQEQLSFLEENGL